MSFTACSCADGANNVGQPNCVDVFARSKYLIFVQTRQNDGTLNSIAPTDTINQLFLDGKVNADKDERWYVMPLHKNYAAERAEAITEDIDGIPFNVAQGNKTVSFEYIDKVGAPPVVNSINSFACGSYSYFIVTQSNEIVGVKPSGEDNLLPIAIEQGTLYARFMEPTKTTKARTMAQMLVREDVNDGDLKMIPSTAITANLSDNKAVAEINLELTTPQTLATEIEVTATFKYFGTFPNNQPLEGITSTSAFVVTNTTTSLTVVVSGITETAPGVYTLTIPAQTTADLLEVEITTTSLPFFESNAPTIVSL